jgi:hypothetical protein
MIKSVFWVAVGAAGALQADRWIQKKKARFTPNAVAGSMLDRINTSLEKRQTTTTSGYPS